LTSILLYAIIFFMINRPRKSNQHNQAPSYTRPARRAQIVAAATPLPLIASCSREPKQSTTCTESSASITAEVLANPDRPQPNPDGTQVEQIAYWAAGAGDDNVTIRDLIGGSNIAERINDGDKKDLARELVSDSAAMTAEFWAGCGTGDYVTRSNLNAATNFAKVAANKGSRGDEAHQAVSKGAEDSAEFWAHGGKDGPATRPELEKAIGFAKVAANEGSRGDEAHEVVSKGAADSAEFWAHGGENGPATRPELEKAIGFAKVAANEGSRGDEAHEVVSKGAADSAEFWAHGGENGPATDKDLKIAERFSKMSANQAEEAESLRD
jgi:hypothetical protein